MLMYSRQCLVEQIPNLNSFVLKAYKRLIRTVERPFKPFALLKIASY